MDFFTVKEQEKKIDKEEYTYIYPDFKVSRTKDLMIRGKSFYAIWDENEGLWSTDEYDVQRLVDLELMAYKDKFSHRIKGTPRLRLMGDFSSGSWKQYRQYLQNVSDNAKPLDSQITWANTQVKKEDYVSKRLPYSLEEGDHSAWDELVSTLYNPEERAKIEWCIGAIVSGDSKDIQKFAVFYGSPGSGKSTIMGIIAQLFRGYTTTFEADVLTSSNNQFATAMLKDNPMVAIQHDTNLSNVKDVTRLNSIVSHEDMVINEKNKPQYTIRLNTFLIVGTNKPVKITDAKSGIIRRLIDITPTGNLIPPAHYQALMARIEFEHGAIAQHCLDVYRSMGKNYYANYRPIDMMMQTDAFFNFVEWHYEDFKEDDGVTLVRAYDMYKQYCHDSSLEFVMPRYKFRDELKNYFRSFEERARIGEERFRSYFSGFITDKFTQQKPVSRDKSEITLVLDQEDSLLDEMLADCPAQYGNASETPLKGWDDVTTKLSDLNTGLLHFLRMDDPNHIVIDFDLKDEKGNKSVERNLAAASTWPPTYAEYSKSGAGVHLHYMYEGDVDQLSRVYSEGIEVKVYNGKSSLRRRLTKCNNIPVATISSGLPLKEVKATIKDEVIKSERGLRTLIERNLRKEIHPSTKPSIDFIKKILDDAYSSDLEYDVSDMRASVLTFAMNSTNQAKSCMQAVKEMKFRSESDISQAPDANYKDAPIVFYDVEVFPNLFVVCWKYRGKENKPVRMINPSPQEIEQLMKYRLVGFFNRRYDNHILYARYMGFTNEALYDLSQRLTSGSRDAYFAEAYGLSYADVYDFASEKKSLKIWQIELGIHHQELGLPWDQPVPEKLWTKVAEYCDNDVISTEETFEARHGDFVARQILADLSGLTVNDTTQKHAAKILFGDDKNHKDEFIYTHLEDIFKGYKYEYGKSTYHGEVVGEGGLVRSKPGMYTNVALLDVASMHPTSIKELRLFGAYTQRFVEIMEARLAIKHRDFDTARSLLGGALRPYLGHDGHETTDEQRSARLRAADQLAYALKIVINTVYGLTSAGFDNPFRDPRNKDNIVAKRGALFMMDLKRAVEEKGFEVIHVKTDSIKIPNATPEIIEFVSEFGEVYGYSFEHEATYDKFCLVNDAVYIAKIGDKWTATGAQFKHPYVFKTLFSKDPLDFDDVCETKSVTTHLALDMNEDLPDGEHNYIFVGKAGQFCPMQPGTGGGILVREKDGAYNAATGTKGYRWLESEQVKAQHREEDVDHTYFNVLVDKAVAKISEFGDFEWFVSD